MTLSTAPKTHPSPPRKLNRRKVGTIMMNNGNSETSHSDQTSRLARTPPKATTSSIDELTRLKHALLQAEVRLAKARATAAGAEIDIKVLTSQLKAFTK